MTPADLDRIGAEADVSALLSLQHNDCLAYWGIDYGQMCAHGTKLKLRMARSPMRDFDIADQRRRLPNAVAALADLQAQGHRTYVHCTAGLGRAPLTVLSYLICFEGRSPQEAIRLIHNGRSGAVPAWEAYHGWRAELVGQHRPRIQHHAYELSQARAGDQGDAEADWLQAEAKLIRSVLANITHTQDKAFG